MTPMVTSTNGIEAIYSVGGFGTHLSMSSKRSAQLDGNVLLQT